MSTNDDMRCTIRDMNPLSGMGMYVRGISTKAHGTPSAMGAKCLKYGIDFVVIMATWQQPKGNKVVTKTSNMKVVEKYAKALRSRGVKVLVWGYPWAGHEQEFVDSISRVQDAGGIAELPLIDPELGYKWKGGSRKVVPHGVHGTKEAIKGTATGYKTGVVASANKLTELLMDRFGGHHVTSYGIPGYHPNFPWSELLGRAISNSPQFYTTSPAQNRKGSREWVQKSKDVRILPSFPTFGKNDEERLHGYMAALMHLDTGIGVTPQVTGFIGWSWRQTSVKEFQVIKFWSDELKRIRAM